MKCPHSALRTNANAEARVCPNSPLARHYKCPACAEKITLVSVRDGGYHDEDRCPKCGVLCCFTCDYAYESYVDE